MEAIPPAVIESGLALAVETTCARAETAVAAIRIEKKTINRFIRSSTFNQDEKSSAKE
jgi:hypothetical protein